VIAAQIADISMTRHDGFARAVRKGLGKRGVRTGLPVVFSSEPLSQGSMQLAASPQRFKRSYYGTMSYMPALFGLHAAAHVIDEISGMHTRREKWRASRAQRRAASNATGGSAGGLSESCSDRGFSGETDHAAPLLFYDI
jgi:tRNA threonylcarbamoyladenosine dehydratase